eukprot:scaffold2418_cov175-Amphora_coffeaeformis.AAC.10
MTAPVGRFLGIGPSSAQALEAASGMRGKMCSESSLKRMSRIRRTAEYVLSSRRVDSFGDFVVVMCSLSGKTP